MDQLYTTIKRFLAAMPPSDATHANKKLLLLFNSLTDLHGYRRASSKGAKNHIPSTSDQKPIWAPELCTLASLADRVEPTKDYYYPDRAAQITLLFKIYQSYFSQKKKSCSLLYQNLKDFWGWGDHMLNLFEHLDQQIDTPDQLWEKQPPLPPCSPTTPAPIKHLHKIYPHLALLRRHYQEALKAKGWQDRVSALCGLREATKSPSPQSITGQIIGVGLKGNNKLERQIMLNLYNNWGATFFSPHPPYQPFIPKVNKVYTLYRAEKMPPLELVEVDYPDAQYPLLFKKLTQLLSGKSALKIGCILPQTALADLLQRWPRSLPLPYTSGGIDLTCSALYGVLEQLLQLYQSLNDAPSRSINILARLCYMPRLKQERAALQKIITKQSQGYPLRPMIAADQGILGSFYKLLASYTISPHQGQNTPPSRVQRIDFWHKMIDLLTEPLQQQTHKSSEKKTAPSDTKGSTPNHFQAALRQHLKQWSKNIAQKALPYTPQDPEFLYQIRAEAKAHKISYEAQPDTPIKLIFWQALPHLSGYTNLVGISAQKEALLSKPAEPQLLAHPTFWQQHGVPTTAQLQTEALNRCYHLMAGAETLWFSFYKEGTQGIEATTHPLALQYSRYYPQNYQLIRPQSPPPSRTPVNKLIWQRKKTEPIQKQLQELAATYKNKPLTPSALNLYLACPYQFYRRYIQKRKAAKPLLEAPHPHPEELGSWLHRSMELLYTPYLHQRITTDLIQKLKQEAYAITQKVGLEQLDPQANRTNLNLRYQIWHQAIYQQVLHLLNQDIEEAPFEILALEKKIAHPIDLPKAGITLSLGGIIDRLERKAGQIRIVDYKRGKGLSKLPPLRDWFFSAERGTYTTPIQLLFYSWLYLKDSGQQAAITPKVLAPRAPIPGSTLLHFPLEPDQPSQACYNITPHLDEFENYLITTLEEIWAPSIPFAHPESRRGDFNCRYSAACQL